ncbi:MAG: GntR family transcriptional regulator [Oscillospiraceae bacterium]
MENTLPKIPKYLQIYQQIKRDIDSNKYGPDSRFPSENDLMVRFNASRTTIRHATKLLQDDGLIKSCRGRGTEILSTLQARNISRGKRQSEVYRVDFNFLGASIQDSSSSEPLIDVVPAQCAVAEALDIPPKSDVYRIRWLHFINDLPYLYLINFVRMDMAPDLPEHIHGMLSLYPILSEYYGMNFTLGEETVEPTVADFISARLLEVEIGTPLLLLRRSSLCDQGPLEYSLSTIRPDLLQINLQLRNTSPDVIV